jgi:hypothetical protein
VHNVNSERLINRLEQLLNEIQRASGFDYHDRLREFKQFCDATPLLANIITQLPEIRYDFSVSWRSISNMWPGGRESYGMRWNAIVQMVVEDGKVNEAWLQVDKNQISGLQKITDMIVVPIVHFFVDQIELSSAIMYVLLRYKRWVEWFEADYLRDVYKAEEHGGETALDENLRQFLFESGIDYPFSQPASPRGRVDIVAGLETDDPLVLEIKVWDSTKGYREDRVRDGLRQVMDYANKYGKDTGYVVVFNLDQQPLSFDDQKNVSEWPPKLERGGKIYYFIDIHIAEKTKPVSQREKGKQVDVKNVELDKLFEE